MIRTLKVKSFIEEFFFTTLVTIFIFNIKFKGLPPGFLMASAIILLISIYFILKEKSASKYIFRPIIFLMPFLFSFLISAIVNAKDEYFLISMFLGIFFIISIAPHAFLSYFKGREIYIIRLVINAGLINAVFIIGMFLSNDFKMFYISLLSDIDLLNVKGESAINSLYSMRLVGLTGSATYGMAVVQMIMAFLFVFYTKKTKRTFNNLSYLVLFSIIVSAIISGRTAFVGLLFLFPLLFFLVGGKGFIKFVGLFSIALFMFFLIAKYTLPVNIYDFFEGWIFQLFSKGADTGSFNENIRMLSKFDLNNFSLFGDFQWHSDESRTSYYMGTDVGWYRFAFAFGEIGVLLFVLYLFSFLKPALKINSAMITILISITFLFFVMFKGAIFFDFYMIYFVFSILYFLSNNRIHRNAL